MNAVEESLKAEKDVTFEKLADEKEEKTTVLNEEKKEKGENDSFEKEEITKKCENEKEEVKWFKCSTCNLKEVYDSKTTKPDFVRHMSFNEPCYVAKDPFTPPDRKQFFILGSDCCVCRRPVCLSKDCSIYYRQRYCQTCAWEKRKFFPHQLKSKIKSQN